MCIIGGRKTYKCPHLNPRKIYRNLQLQQNNKQMQKFCEYVHFLISAKLFDVEDYKMSKVMFFSRKMIINALEKVHMEKKKNKSSRLV